MPEKEGEEEKVVKTTSNTSLNVNFLSGPAQAICDTPPLHSLTDHTHIKAKLLEANYSFLQVEQKHMRYTPRGATM